MFWGCKILILPKCNQICWKKIARGCGCIRCIPSSYLTKLSMLGTVQKRRPNKIEKIDPLPSLSEKSPHCFILLSPLSMRAHHNFGWRQKVICSYCNKEWYDASMQQEQFDATNSCGYQIRHLSDGFIEAPCLHENARENSSYSDREPRTLQI